MKCKYCRKEVKIQRALRNDGSDISFYYHVFNSDLRCNMLESPLGENTKYAEYDESFEVNLILDKYGEVDI